MNKKYIILQMLFIEILSLIIFLIDENDNLKIADFGISRIFTNNDEMQSNAGTKSFMPPESFKGIS